MTLKFDMSFGRVVGIAGATNAGKTTLVRKLLEEFSADKKVKVSIVLQDDYFKEKEEVEQVQSQQNVDLKYWNYDAPQSLNENDLYSKVKRQMETFDLVVVEGNMITELPSLCSIFNRIIFVTIDYETCKKRRELREDYDPPDLPGYFDEIVWPAYEEHLKSAQALKDPRISFVNGNDSTIYETVVKMAHFTLDEHLKLQQEAIDVNQLTDFVTSSKCGAISVFIGTTRDNFEGQIVKNLWYEHYAEMAYCELKKLCLKVRREFQSISKIAIVHRVGNVPITEKSVVIATSAPHRQEAIRATEFLIDELKLTVPIWKKIV
ncbi:Molybdopterin converting factor, subunit 2 [Aphelenchoides besseyi]|nr:Molybdopterin converting factor, subunit 2 [Aphelenchoides besseyi]